VGDCDCELGKTLPQIGIVFWRRFPCILENLMGLERSAGVEQLLGLAQGLHRASCDALGLTRHTR
jgi:hypothetical protein